MTPKTELQKKVVELSEKLPAITEKQKQFAFENCLEKYAKRIRSSIKCLECGHTWKDESYLVSSIVGCKCPNCSEELKLTQATNNSAYFSILTTKAGFQIVRMFWVQKKYYKHSSPDLLIYEVMQHWIDRSGKVETISKKVNNFSSYFDAWIFNSSFELMGNSERANSRYSLGPYKTYPDRKIIPEIKRNGYKGNLHGMTPQHFFSFILRDSKAETLLKAKQIDLFKFIERRSNIDEYWPVMKICIRNNYIVKDASLWFDQLELLKYFGKDLRNPKYVCPVNLKKEHNKLVDKKREIDRKMRIEEMRERLEAEQVMYSEQKGKFFDLAFSDSDLFIKPLETVEEFMIEGDELRHCVFANEYYKKDNSLILSARIDNKPVETIEFSLSQLKVIQSRGFGNKATEHHDRIVDLVSKNIPIIQKALTI